MVTKPCVSSSGNFPESTHHMKIAGTSQMITMIDIRALVYSPGDGKNSRLLVSELVGVGRRSPNLHVKLRYVIFDCHDHHLTCVLASEALLKGRQDGVTCRRCT